MKHLGRLLVVSLAAGGAGTLSELHTAWMAPTPPPVSVGLSAFSPDFSVFTELFENGDGTASAIISMPLSPHEHIGQFAGNLSTYTISADLQPGQSGLGGGSGTCIFTMEVYVLDTNTFTYSGPFDCVVDLEVAGATNVNAYVRQGITTASNPFTGETSIVREHVIGNQASGDNVGSASVWFDQSLVGGFQGGYGLLQVDNTHSREVIR